ncbi:hypothetical protein [Photobacterium leiognathi]|uniref:hypothetical protein n=1 Tax=Photobacterium leiognathi TaxID=553611 RepID=UPI002980A329|nr:hypothetical protein [Photobacterium leiognathi]
MKLIYKKELWNVVKRFLDASSLNYKQRLLCKNIFDALDEKCKCVIESDVLCESLIVHRNTLYRHRERVAESGLFDYKRIGVGTIYEYTLNLSVLSGVGLDDVRALTIWDLHGKQVEEVIKVSQPFCEVTNTTNQGTPELTTTNILSLNY